MIIAASGHLSPGLWRHPEDQSTRYTDIDHWVELAKLLEEAKFHSIFIADVLGKQNFSFRPIVGTNNKRVQIKKGVTMSTRALSTQPSAQVPNGR
jgi:hypothetical protein